ncbi:uncharacterized protein LOC110443317 [Mizuhopecten yessoensis]|uniref:uncharacterized protein LOC110443317 n=1 Tax=Mizuhopecten yessoensis TaxID=6573 RepID=UPI000B45D8C4|nr:uncharacterized protein LOC110443317 [Mizuhopecten yessoensis]
MSVPLDCGGNQKKVARCAEHHKEERIFKEEGVNKDGWWPPPVEVPFKPWEKVVLSTITHDAIHGIEGAADTGPDHTGDKYKVKSGDLGHAPGPSGEMGSAPGPPSGPSGAVVIGDDQLQDALEEEEHECPLAMGDVVKGRKKRKAVEESSAGDEEDTPGKTPRNQNSTSVITNYLKEKNDT